MEREIGRTGRKVFPVGLGGMPLSVAGRPEEPRALETLKAALEAGVDLIDTADVYCLGEGDIGHNERLIAKALKAAGRLKSAALATKGGLARPRGEWTNEASPRRLRAACEASLKALEVEAIFLYQLHAPDPKIPFADSVGELSRLKQEGKIRHVGLSNVDAGELAEAQRIVRIESVQNRCNPFHPGDYQDGLLQACERDGVAYLPYGVVGGHRGQFRVGDHPLLGELGRKHGASPFAVVVAWHLAKSPRVLPIPGASRPESIKDSASATGLRLDKDDIAAIDSLADPSR